MDTEPLTERERVGKGTGVWRATRISVWKMSVRHQNTDGCLVVTYKAMVLRQQLGLEL